MRTETTDQFSLFTETGERKYLTPQERLQFMNYAKLQDRETRTFCLLLAETGVRISEGLSVTANSFDFETKSLVVQTLKKRRGGVYRSIPLSDEFLNEMNLVHELRDKQRSKKGRQTKLWDFVRRTGLRRVDRVMQEAGLYGEKATPKGLRHSFAVYCIIQGIPLPTVQKWLGHSSMSTTAIYLQVTGDEERALASRLWRGALSDAIG